MRLFIMISVLTLMLFARLSRSDSQGRGAPLPTNLPPPTSAVPLNPPVISKKDHRAWLGSTLIRQYHAAKTVVRGRVENVQTKLEKDHEGNELAVSTIQLSVLEVFKGTPNDTMQFGSFGGIIGEFLYTITHSPQFEQGEEVIVFLGERGKKPFVLGGIPLPKLLIENEIVNPGRIPLPDFRLLIFQEDVPHK